MSADVITAFIAGVWNGNEPAGSYLHPEFTDHSLPPELPRDAEGTSRWIALTSESFRHRTVIEDRVTEGDKTILRITLHLRHIGTWRGVPPTGKEVSIPGYRMFRVRDGKIIEHRALIAGDTLEKRLREATGGFP